MAESSQDIRLLLVDDEAEFLQAVKPGLTRRGFRVATAEDGLVALRLLSSETFDVVVLDVKMPGIDGVDTFLEMRRIAPTLPVILLTGHGNIEQAFETSRAGVYEYLTKPCDVGKLAEVARMAVERAAQREVTQPPPGEGIRVLLVDDDRDFVESLAPALQRRGLVVESAHGGEEALERVREGVFDVAIVDVLMPGMNGLTLLRRLQEADSLLEVIVLTGHPNIHDVKRGLQDGAFDFLIKPQPVEELYDRIRAAFERREQRREDRQRSEVERILSKRPD